MADATAPAWQRLMDESEIRTVLQRYCRSLDEHRPDLAVRAVYTADATDDRGRAVVPKGHEEIEQFFVNALAHIDGTAHLLGGSEIVIDDTGERATSTCYVTAWHWSAGANIDPARPADFAVVGAYEDEWRRTPDGWRISARVFRRLGAGGVLAGELPAAFRSFLGGTAVSVAPKHS